MKYLKFSKYNKMKQLGVCFFASIYERTGAGKVVRSFKESGELFARNGLSTTMYSLDTDDIPMTVRKKDGKLVRRLKTAVNWSLKQSAKGSYELIDRLYYNKGRGVIGRNWEDIKKKDVLIFHEIYTCNAYIEKCEKEGLVPKPFILVLHNNGELFKMDTIYYPKIVGSKYMKVFEGIADKCLAAASRVVFVAQGARDNFRTLYPKYAEKAHTVYNGIADLEKENRPLYDGSVRMVTVGTVNVRKNQLMQVEVMGRFKGNDKISLTIVGGGDCLSDCEKLAKDLGVDNQISFLGGRDDIPQILSGCNLFVMSSLDEGLPIAAIEAMRSGLPIVLTDVGGDKELIDGNGFLINPKAGELYDALVMFMESTEKQQQMSERSRKLFKEKFCTDTMIEEYCKLINSIA